jgi:hypothetical protein
MTLTLQRLLTRVLPFVSLGALLGLPAGAATGERTTRATEGLKGIYDSLRKVELDTTRSAPIENLVIQRDITKITLVSGRLWVAKPWREGAAPAGAWFSGEGTIQSAPPTKVEKKLVKKTFEKDVIDEKFTQAFLRFNDEFWESIKDKMGPDGAGSAEAAKLFAERHKLLDDLNFNIEFPVINDHLTEGPRAPFFYFEFPHAKQGWITFFYSQTQLEESTFFKHKKVGFGDFQSVNVITSFHDKADYDSGKDLGHEDKDTIWIRHYSGEITVDRDGLLLTPKIDMEIESLVDGLKILPMSFMSYYIDESHPFTLEIVKDGEGKPLEFLHANFQLIIALPKALNKGEKTKVHVEYTADYIRPDAAIGAALDGIPDDIGPFLRTKLDKISEDGATFTLLNTYPWFPQAGYLKRHTFDWTVKVPTPYVPVASGSTKRRWKEEGYECLHTVETTPVALSSMLFGRYKTESDTSARPAIHVHALSKQQKQARVMLVEARSIVTEYEKWFGPFPYDELDIAQMGFLYGFGQAPPGLVQLTAEAFISSGELLDIFDILMGNARLDPSFVHGFLAHEIGHEWWGHAVSWANPSDQWLSESYTEYCSGLYVQATAGQKAFEAELRGWRERAARSKDAGPISLGGRLGDHYTAQTYNKGPYVLHMLRLALQAQAVAAGGTAEDGDKLFFESLKSFIAKFRNQNATTLDYQKVLKATAKVDMDWFFDEWFRGDKWLNLEFKYEVRPTEDGKHLLKATFKQPDKDNIKQVAIPMYIHFGKDRVTSKMIFLNKAEYVYQAKLAEAPEKVTVNDGNDVLADIKYN